MQASRLQSKFSKRKVRLRKTRAKNSLLPSCDIHHEAGQAEVNDQSHVILPIETEVEYNRKTAGSWTNSTYQLKPTSAFLLAERGTL